LWLMLCDRNCALNSAGGLCALLELPEAHCEKSTEVLQL